MPRPRATGLSRSFDGIRVLEASGTIRGHIVRCPVCETGTYRLATDQVHVGRFSGLSDFLCPECERDPLSVSSAAASNCSLTDLRNEIIEKEQDTEITEIPGEQVKQVHIRLHMFTFQNWRRKDSSTMTRTGRSLNRRRNLANWNRFLVNYNSLVKTSDYVVSIGLTSIVPLLNAVTTTPSYEKERQISL